MKIEDDMREFLENGMPDDKPLPEWLTKWFIRIIAVFLGLLMLSFILINYTTIGQLVSEPVQNNQLAVGEVTVQFSDEPLNMILSSYRLEVETPLCLQGQKVGDTYYIDSAYIPAIFSQSRTHVTHAACEDTLILFHTHPYKSCLASGTDLNTLNRNQELDPDIIMIIMCEPNRFSLYT